MSNKPSIIALTRTVTNPYLSKYARAISISSASGGRSRIFQTKYNEENTPRKMSGRAIVFQMFLDTCFIFIKKFSSPKIKIWFEPMFFSGFFCGFERCGSAAFPNFRGGTSSPPQEAKCVRTNSRILHHVGKLFDFSYVVPRVGLEPTSFAAHGPKPCVSANFTTSAKNNKQKIMEKHFFVLF